jgi:Icc-related predicted phosphoesterase
MTKILAAGDIHGDTGLVKKLAKKAKKENVDLIILAGDIANWMSDTKNLVGPFAKLKKPVLLLHGNHESLATIDFLTELYSPEAKNLHGYSLITKDKVGIFGAGGADFGLSPMSEKDFFKTLEKAYNGLKGKGIKKKIMVTHMHPFMSKAEFSGFEGSKGIRKAIKNFKPDLLLSGHIHEAEGIEEKIGKTKILHIGRKGKVIEV